jgi:CHAD domain-containing protein
MAERLIPYALRHHEDLKPGLIRILETMGKDAEELAGKAEAELPESVHQLRTLIKRLRAYLWLMRPVLGKARCTHSNAALRKAGHRLEKTRDVHAVKSALTKAAHPDAHAEELQSLVQVSEDFSQREASGRKSTTPLAPLKKSIGTVTEVIAGALLQAKQTEEWPSVKKRLGKALRLTGKSEKKARPSNDTALVHEWRKKAKRFFYLLQLTQRLSGTSGDEVGKADKLQELLGDHQDAVVAENYLRKHGTHLDAGDLKRAGRLLKKTRERLLKDAGRCWRELVEEF